MTSKNDSVEYKVMLKGFMWIGIILIIIILSLVVLALKPTITVNNYISAGNYTFDVGPNMAKYMDQQNVKAVANTPFTPSNSFFVAGPRLNITSEIVINLSCVEETQCECAKNTSTPCMVMCFKEKNTSECKYD